MKTLINVEQASFEVLLNALEKTVAEIESGGLTLDEMVKNVAQAHALAKECHERLRVAGDAIAHSAGTEEQPE